MKTIGKEVFHDCNTLEKIDLPEGLTSIEEGTFGNCDSLKHIEFQSKLEKIVPGSFYNTRIERITIPKGVWEI